MRAFTFSFAATGLAFIMGCQSPKMNNPVATNDDPVPQAITKPAPLPSPNQIAFNQKVSYATPGPVDQTLRATGNVLFSVTKLPVIPGTADSQYDVRIDVKGEIVGILGAADPWKFGALSKDRITIPQGEKAPVTKIIPVQGPATPTLLEIQFTVSENAVAIGTMSLTREATGTNL